MNNEEKHKQKQLCDVYANAGLPGKGNGRPEGSDLFTPHSLSMLRQIRTVTEPDIIKRRLTENAICPGAIQLAARLFLGQRDQTISKHIKKEWRYRNE